MKRYEELDSLRGLAALAVLLSHFLNLLPSFTTDIHAQSGMWLQKMIRYTPLRVIYAGQESVILFFVLSGFVLSLMYYNGKSVQYPTYLKRRICRIYIPYVIAVLIAMTMAVLLQQGRIEGLSSWFNDLNWHTPLTWPLLIDHLLLIGEFNTAAFNTVIWSLVHEMRISIIFPLLMVMVIRLNWKTSMLIVFGLSCLSILLHKQSSLFLTTHYIFMFVVGALLAKYKEQLVAKYNSFTIFRKTLIFLIGVLLFSYFRVPNWGFEFMRYLGKETQMITQWFTTAGAACFIVAALSGGLFSKLLSTKLARFLGKISYSLYLYHCIVLFAMVNLLHGVVPLGLLLIAAFMLTLAVSAAAYYGIEQPAIRLGKQAILLRRLPAFRTVSEKKNG